MTLQKWRPKNGCTNVYNMTFSKRVWFICVRMLNIKFYFRPEKQHTLDVYGSDKCSRPIKISLNTVRSLLSISLTLFPMASIKENHLICVRLECAHQAHSPSASHTNERASFCNGPKELNKYATTTNAKWGFTSMQKRLFFHS